MHVRWKPKVMFETLMQPSVMPKRRLKYRPQVMHVRINCNVRNIDLLIVALDEPECADEVSLAQLVNTGQPCF